MDLYMKRLSKSSLAIELAGLRDIEGKKVRVEQYSTESEIAAEVLWEGYMKGDLRGVVADLGCGNGILGLGALLLGSRRVYFADSDGEAIETAKENYEKLKSEGKIAGDGVFLVEDVEDFIKVRDKVDCVVENPPFGTKIEHADRKFLGVAFKIAAVIWSFHKTSTKDFVERFAEDNGFIVTNVFDYNFPIKHSFEFHKKPKKMIEVSCFRFVKQ